MTVQGLSKGCTESPISQLSEIPIKNLIAIKEEISTIYRSTLWAFIVNDCPWVLKRVICGLKEKVFLASKFGNQEQDRVMNAKECCFECLKKKKKIPRNNAVLSQKRELQEGKLI